jgi:hypothetical protein
MRREPTMAENILSSATQWIYTHSSFWDVSMALLGLFVFQCINDRLTNKGPMLWPVLGIIPTMFLHVNDMNNFVTRALSKAGGTFHHKGMWMGGAYGIVTADPSSIEYMLKTNFKNFPKGKYFRERFQDLLGDGIFNADDELWREQRQAVRAEMHSSRFIEHSLRTMKDLVHQKLLKLTDIFFKYRVKSFKILQIYYKIHAIFSLKHVKILEIFIKKNTQIFFRFFYHMHVACLVYHHFNDLFSPLHMNTVPTAFLNPLISNFIFP